MAAALKRIDEYNTGIPADLKAMKWAAMKESPFRFYRGTAHLFAQDYVKLSNLKPKVRTWICGDLHFENFGSYKAENRLVYFDLNDFDEAVLASPEPEITRFITSVIIASGQMKVSPIDRHKALHDIIEAYTTTLLKGKALLLQAEVAHGAFKRYFEQLTTFDRASFIAKHTAKEHGALRLKPDETHFLPLPDARKAEILEHLTPLLNHSKRFGNLVFEDLGFRIAGTGSLGLERYCVLCYCKHKGKRYLLDVKEARQSCYTGLIEGKQPKFANEAERVIMAGYIMQFISPAFMAPVQIGDKWYIVKELQYLADKMSLGDFNNNFNLLAEVAMEMAVLMAYAHIRSSGLLGASPCDDLRKFAEKKKWQEDILELSAELAKRNNTYYKEFRHKE